MADRMDLTEVDRLGVSAIFLLTAVATLIGVALNEQYPARSRQHLRLAGWQRALGEVLESKLFVVVVILLIHLDLLCTVTASIAEEAWAEVAERVGFSCLLFFFAEQMLHLAAFGVGFFNHPWFVLDLVAVSLSAAVDLNVELAKELKLVGAVRLWKLVVFIFDVALVREERKEL